MYTLSSKKNIFCQFLNSNKGCIVKLDIPWVPSNIGKQDIKLKIWIRIALYQYNEDDFRFKFWFILSC